QQRQPVSGLLDTRRAFDPDRAGVHAAVERTLDHVRRHGQSASLSLTQVSHGSVRKEVDAQVFGWDVAFASVCSLGAWQAFLVATSRRGTVEIEIGPRGEQIPNSSLAHTQTINFLEDT